MLLYDAQCSTKQAKLRSGVGQNSLAKVNEVLPIPCSGQEMLQ